MAVVSLILGILALICPFFNFYAAIIFGIVGIILGALGRKKDTGKGMATAGLVLSIVALAICVIMYVACAAFLASL